MKNSIFILLIGILSLGCTGDDLLNEQIVGEWKLVEAQFYGVNGEGEFGLITEPYSEANIIYNFQADGTLLVSGEDNMGYNSGEYNYEFKKDYLTGYPAEGEKTILLVTINGSKWTYNFSDDLMILGTSYVDGPDLYLERK